MYHKKIKKINNNFLAEHNNVYDDIAEMYKISYKFDEKNKIFWIYDFFDNNLEIRFCSDVYRMMKKYKNSNKKPKFHINISSFGGYVDSGLAMYDIIEKSGFVFDGYCNGSCYSMAAFFLSSLNGERKMSKYAKYCQHGTFTYEDERLTKEAIESHMEANKIDRKVMDDILIKRSDGKLNQKKMSYINKIHFKHFTAKEALDYGLIDKVI